MLAQQRHPQRTLQLLLRDDIQPVLPQRLQIHHTHRLLARWRRHCEHRLVPALADQRAARELRRRGLRRQNQRHTTAPGPQEGGESGVGGGEAIACGGREIGQNVMEKTETGQAIGVGGATQGVGWAEGGFERLRG